LIMSAYLWSAAAASLLGIIGYFNLLPGAYDLFTSFGRARGAFKDPNVFGPYLVPPIVYGVHLWLSRPVSKAIVPLTLIVIMAFALFLSFSRGAWVNLAIALSVFGYLSFILARSNWARFKLAIVALASLAAIAIVAMAALQFDSIANLADQRVSLDQTYDQGPEGRFGGQLKAIRLILDNPLGIGAGEFTQRHHHEEVHNIYLSMLLNNGWAGGILYALTVLITLLYGLRQLLRFTQVQPLLIVTWSCFLAVVIEGFLIDTDHWRHFFLLVGMIWGLGETARAPQTVTVGHLPARLRRVLATQPRLRPAIATQVPFRTVPRRERAQHFHPAQRLQPALRSTWPCEIKLAPPSKRVRPLPGSLRLN
jgi:O-antigen ligase